VDTVRIKQTIKQIKQNFAFWGDLTKAAVEPNYSLRRQIKLNFGTLTTNRWCIVDVEFWQNRMPVVKITQMYKSLFILCNGIGAYW